MDTLFSDILQLGQMIDIGLTPFPPAPNPFGTANVPILGAQGNASKMGAMTRSIHRSAYGALRENLRALRVKAGLSQRALAARLGVPHSWVAKVESGERRIDVVEFAEFARA